MSNPFERAWRNARRLWAAFRRKDASLPPSGVLLHDPVASGPHDLDDPFFDPKVQERVAEVIAGSARRTQPGAQQEQKEKGSS